MSDIVREEAAVDEAKHPTLCICGKPICPECVAASDPRCGVEWCACCGEDPPLNADGYCPKCVEKEKAIEP